MSELIDSQNRVIDPDLTVQQRIREVGLERGLRPTTVRSYEVLLRRLSLLPRRLREVTRQDCIDLVWTLDNPNTRRATVVAMRSVWGYDIKIPKGVPRRYELPDEDTLRIALMTSPHEIRGLLMMYAGCRIGEACAVTERQVSGDRLTIDRQMIHLCRTGEESRIYIAPVKTSEAAIVIPTWLGERLSGLTATARPASVRESLRRAGKKVGVHLNPHMLRHWYATTLLSRGIPLSLVSQQMRHSDVAVTLRSYSQHNSAAIHEVFPS